MKTPLNLQEYVTLMQTSIISNLLATLSELSGKQQKEIQDFFAQKSLDTLLEMPNDKLKEIALNITETHQKNYKLYLAGFEERNNERDTMV